MPARTIPQRRQPLRVMQDVVSLFLPALPRDQLEGEEGVLLVRGLGGGGGEVVEEGAQGGVGQESVALCRLMMLWG